MEIEARKIFFFEKTQKIWKKKKYNKTEKTFFFYFQ